MKKLFLILSFFICSLSFGQVNTQSSTKYKPQNLDVASPSKGQIYFNNDIAKYRYWDGTEWITLDNVDQDNKNQLINVRIGVNGTLNEKTVANKINALPAFSVDDKHNIIIVAVKPQISGKPIRYTYLTKELGKGSYGVGGTVISGSQLLLLNAVTPSITDIETDPDTQFIELGTVTGNITDVFNNHTFTGTEVPVQGQDEGYVLINVNLNNTDLQYLFIGEGGTYGTSGLSPPATIDDFILLTDILQSASTQFIDLGELAETPIEDVFNALNPCQTVQLQTEGYVIIDVTIASVPYQYLFTGAGGSYGAGCDQAVAEDFVQFYAIAEAQILQDIWHNRDTNIYGVADELATNYLAPMKHGALISATGLKLPVNTAGTTLGISTDGYGPLPIQGNYGILFKGGNANHTIFNFISDGVASATQNNFTRRGIYERRDFRSTAISDNYFPVGIEVNDFVNLSTNTNSKYASFRANPQVTGTGFDTYSFYADRGDMMLNNADIFQPKIKAPSGETYALTIDDEGKYGSQAIGGGGGAFIPLAGTEVGSPVTGDIEFLFNDVDIEDYGLIGNRIGGSVLRLNMSNAGSENSDILLFSSSDGDNSTRLTMSEGAISLGVDNLSTNISINLDSVNQEVQIELPNTSKGLTSSTYYGANYSLSDRNVYPQVGFIDDNFIAKPTEGTDGQVLTTDGDGTYTWEDGGSGGGTPLEIYSESGTLGGGDGVATIGDYDYDLDTGSGVYYNQDYSSESTLAIMAESTTIGNSNDLRLYMNSGAAYLGSYGGYTSSQLAIFSNATSASANLSVTGASLTLFDSDALDNYISLIAPDGIQINTKNDISGEVRFKTDNVTTQRVLQAPNQSGTIALTSDFNLDGTPYSSGTVIDLSDNVTGQTFNKATPSTADAFSFAALKQGGYAINYVDTTGDTDFPTLTNASGDLNPTKGDTFREGAIFKLIAETDGTDVDYFWSDYLNTSTGLPAYTVSTLPTGTIGDTAYVTDATTPTYLGALTGGGSVVCPVFFNGTIWVSH